MFLVSSWEGCLFGMPRNFTEQINKNQIMGEGETYHYWGTCGKVGFLDLEAQLRIKLNTIVWHRKKNYMVIDVPHLIKTVKYNCLHLEDFVILN